MLLQKDARKALLEGLSKVATAVGATLGPRGRLAIINRGYGGPEVTKDGVTVAREVTIKDVWENIGASLIKEAAIKTNDVAGDGTTTATVLTHTLCCEALAIMDKSNNPSELKRQIENAAKTVKDYLKSKAYDISNDVEKVTAVATIAANNDSHLGGLIGEAYSQVGKEGLIVMTNSDNDISYITKTEGMEFTEGYASPFFINNVAKQTVEYDNPLVLVTDRKIETVQSIEGPIRYASANNKPLVIACDDIEKSVLSVIIRNNVSNNIKVSVLKVPGFGDFKKEALYDLALFTGATFISSDIGVSLDSINEDDLGSCDRVVMRKSNTLFSGGHGDEEKLLEHTENIRKQIPKETTYNEGKFRERLKRLSGVVATIHVGAVTESELREKMYRVEDAINAVNAAVAEGVVAGGGTTLVRATNLLNGDIDGDQAFMRALYRPFHQILSNAYLNPNDFISDVLMHDGVGLDVTKGKMGNMWELGILDTVKGLSIAIDTAVSVTSTVITTEVLLNSAPDVEDKRGPSEIIPFG